MLKNETNDQQHTSSNDEMQEFEGANDGVSRRKLLTTLGTTGLAMLAGGVLTNTFGTALAGNSTVTMATYGGGSNPEAGACCCMAVTIADLRAITMAATDTLYLVRDRWKEGFFYYDNTDTTLLDNTGTIVVSTVSGARFKRIFEGNVNVKWFGADDSLTDNAAAFQQAIDYCAAEGYNLFVPEGDFSFTNGLQVKCKIEGDSGSNSILRYKHKTGVFLNGALGTGGLLPDLKNLKIYGTRGSDTVNEPPTQSVCMNGYTFRGTYENITVLFFDIGVDIEGVFVHFVGCFFHKCRIALYPRRLSSNGLSSTMFNIEDSSFEFNDNGFLLEQRSTDPSDPVANQELINVRISNSGFEKNVNGLVVKIRIHLLTLLNCWFEANTGHGYDIHKSFPTMLNVKVHPAETVYVGDWASGYGANKGNYNRIDDSGIVGKKYFIAPFEPDSSSAETRKLLLSYSQTSRNIVVSDETNSLLNSNLVRTPTNGFYAAVANIFIKTDGTLAGTSFPVGVVSTSHVATGVYRVLLGSNLFYSPIIHATPYRNYSESPYAAFCKVIPRNNPSPTDWRDYGTMTQFDVYCYEETGTTLVDAKVGITIHFTTSNFFK